MAVKTVDIKFRSRGLKQTKRDTDRLEKSFSGLGSTVARFASGLLAASGILGSLRLIGNEIDKNEIATAKLSSVLKSTGGIAGVTANQVKKLADALARTTNFTRDQTTEAASLLLTFTKITKDIFPKTIRIVQDMATAMGTDMKSSLIQVGKALNDPIKGVGALAEVGVSFTDSQRDMIRVLVESNQVLAAQQIILRELEVEFGGRAVQVGLTLRGSLQDLSEEFARLGAGLVADTIPATQLFIDSIKEQIEILADNIEATKAAIAVIANITATFLGLIITAKIVVTTLALVSSAATITTVAFGALFAPIAIFVAIISAAAAAIQIAKIAFRETKVEIDEFNKALEENELEQAAKDVLLLSQKLSELNKALFAVVGTTKALDQVEVDRSNAKLLAFAITQAITQEEFEAQKKFIAEEKRREEIRQKNQVRALKDQRKFTADQASIRLDLSDRLFLLQEGDFESQRLLIDRQSEIFRQSKADELAILQFVFEAKKQIAIAEINFQADSISVLLTGFSKLATSQKDHAITGARLAQAAAIADTFAGANKAFAQGGIFGFISGAGIIAAGLANVAQIETQISQLRSLAIGGDFITHGPELIQVGDNPGGRERVQVTPISSPNFNGPKAATIINLNFNGPVTSAAFIEDELIPAFKVARHRGLLD